MTILICFLVFTALVIYGVTKAEQCKTLEYELDRKEKLFARSVKNLEGRSKVLLDHNCRLRDQLRDLQKVSRINFEMNKPINPINNNPMPVAANNPRHSSCILPALPAPAKPVEKIIEPDDIGQANDYEEVATEELLRLDREFHYGSYA